MPERVSAWAVYHQFRTADDQLVFIGVTSDRQWPRFCEAFALPELAADPRLKTNNDRIRERDWLLPRLRERIGSLTLAEATERCERAGLPFSPVARPEDLFDDPQLSAGGSLLETRFPNGATGRLPALPLVMGGERWGKRLDPPGLGEHTREVLVGAGFTDEHVTELAEAGVVIAAGVAAPNAGA